MNNRRNYNGSEVYHKLANADIFVWTNLSTAMICEIMKKILRGYGIPVNSLYIYLRADYTPLHIMEADAVKGENTNSADKIGKYVRTSMRKLANDGYAFSDEMLGKLTNGDSTKTLFGIGIPFFKEVTDDTDLSAQSRIKTYIQSVLYARAWSDISSIRIQPL